MTVYKGVLHEISDGEKISSEGTGGYYTENMGIGRWHKTGVDRQAGFVRREIVRIGDARIRSFDPVAEGTRMRWSWDVQTPRALKPLMPLVERLGRRQERRVWSSLKQLLEGQPPA
jgi:hypothetical protein